jgi:hypothetical protein
MLPDVKQIAPRRESPYSERQKQEGKIRMRMTPARKNDGA